LSDPTRKRKIHDHVCGKNSIGEPRLSGRIGRPAKTWRGEVRYTRLIAQMSLQNRTEKIWGGEIKVRRKNKIFLPPMTSGQREKLRRRRQGGLQKKKKKGYILPCESLRSKSVKKNESNSENRWNSW